MKHRYFWIVAGIIIAAIVIVFCVSYFTKGGATEFDGTLVRLNFGFSYLL